MGMSVMLLKKLYLYSICRALCNSAIMQLSKIALLY